ncbi:(2Fe-2S)-binding protein [Litoreibacter albidus]|uniref:(2Fe-2S)-binding protein n=1 Tax=Litoreibacter albidus TaxID=670155 RepID=UPI003734E5FB
MIRLVPNHASKIKRSDKVGFTFDGLRLEGRRGESLAAALLQAGHLNLRTAPFGDAPARGAFCHMGICQECAVRIEGRTVEACRTELTDGLVVEPVS